MHCPGGITMEYRFLCSRWLYEKRLTYAVLLSRWCKVRWGVRDDTGNRSPFGIFPLKIWVTYEHPEILHVQVRTGRRCTVWALGSVPS